jgi:hypothetical protein
MYAKVFAQIFDSSIADDFRLRHFFMDLLVLADADGVVDMTPTAIAARTRIPLEDVTAMLAKLEQPDPESRTPDADGRRIERLDEHRTWGWHLINYHRFRMIASDEQRREKTRERVARFKQKRQQNAAGNAVVTLANAGNAMQKQKQKQKKEFPPVPAVTGKIDFQSTVGEQPNSQQPVKSEAVGSTRFDDFLAGWCDASKTATGVAYVVQGRDRQRLEKFLAACELSPAGLLKLAGEAWRKPKDFHCKNAASITGFCESFNGILQAIQYANAPTDVRGRKLQAPMNLK